MAHHWAWELSRSCRHHNPAFDLKDAVGKSKVIRTC
jgi:hypothetical protein